jgi:ATP-dependent helicase/nuclease subunit B
LPIALEAQEPWLDWAQAAKQTEMTGPVKMPSPCPPLSARPKQLSVTAIETFLENPYAIFARYILRLTALRNWHDAANAQDRGNLIHQALHGFQQSHPEALPAAIQPALIQKFDEAAAQLGEPPRLLAFWRPRFERFAAWYAQTEPERRAGTVCVHSEVMGRLTLALPGGADFTITARADRIDKQAEGGYRLYDFKTSDQAVKSSLALGCVQLALEAIIAREGGFDRLEAGYAASAAYIVAGGGEPPGKHIPVKNLADLMDGALARVTALTGDYGTGMKAYRPAFPGSAFDDYRHLARTGEWGGARSSLR